jgi:hypothetical protein
MSDGLRTVPHKRFIMRADEKLTALVELEKRFTSSR